MMRRKIRKMARFIHRHHEAIHEIGGGFCVSAMAMLLVCMFPIMKHMNNKNSAPVIDTQESNIVIKPSSYDNIDNDEGVDGRHNDTTEGLVPLSSSDDSFDYPKGVIKEFKFDPSDYFVYTEGTMEENSTNDTVYIEAEIMIEEKPLIVIEGEIPPKEEETEEVEDIIVQDPNEVENDTIIEEPVEETPTEEDVSSVVALAEEEFGIELSDAFIEPVVGVDYEYTEEDRDYLIMLLAGECHDTSIDEMLATGSVVLNRLHSEKYYLSAQSIKDIALDQNPCVQYSCMFDGNAYREPTPENIAVAEFLLEHGSMMPANCIYQSMFFLGEGVYTYFPTGTLIMYQN